MKRQRGFVGWIVLIIIALALLKYFFNWSIFDVANSEQGRNTIDYLKEVWSFVWSYLRVPVTFLWQRIIELIPSR